MNKTTFFNLPDMFRRYIRLLQCYRSFHFMNHETYHISHTETIFDNAARRSWEVLTKLSNRTWRGEGGEGSEKIAAVPSASFTSPPPPPFSGLTSLSFGAAKSLSLWTTNEKHTRKSPKKQAVEFYCLWISNNWRNWEVLRDILSSPYHGNAPPGILSNHLL